MWKSWLDKTKSVFSFLSFEEKEKKKNWTIVNKIVAFGPVIKKMTDEELKRQSFFLRREFQSGRLNEEELMVRAFAVAREGARRTIGLYPFPVQLLGAIFLTKSAVIEMKTGEGKSLVAVMPVYFNYLRKKNTQVITVNEYLAERDANWNGPVYEFLGMKVGYVLGRMERDEKRNMYSADVVYLTSSQSAFDYMIDNMVWSLADKMQTKGLNHAIVDEGDSVLIDESRTPNIISGSSDRLSHNYLKADKIVKLLSSEDFKLDKEDKQVFLTPAGIARVETEFGIDNLFSADNAIYFHVIQNSLRAVKLLKKDVDYIVSYDFEKKAKKIVLIDKFTGRILPNRSYSNGLQQAVQAKEGVEIEPETVIRASTTYQNYFRLFKHLSAMTGTAKTEEKEFYEIYRLKTFVIPTNKPMIRTDDADVICINKAYKLESLAEKVKKYHSKGQPVLIGTVSIESSEEVAAALRKVGIFKFELLNAKNHKREAEIVKFAGQKGIITIATNMAGRGTDIVLGPGIAELGGLVVFGTERNEARRIDNQLRGRSGRQGDPGYSRFFVSFEDELPSRFAGDTLKRFISRFFMKDTKIVSPSISRSFDSMQERMEAINFDIRKNLLDYDNVVSQHRTLIYKWRDYVLSLSDGEFRRYLKQVFSVAIGDWVDKSIRFFSSGAELGREKKKLVEIMTTEVHATYLKAADLQESAKKNSQLKLTRFEKVLFLSVLDDLWVFHLNTMEWLKSVIHLRGYAQVKPVHAFTIEGLAIFNLLKLEINRSAAVKFFAFVWGLASKKKETEGEQEYFLLQH